MITIMLDIWGTGLLIFFAIVGMAECCRAFVWFLLRPEKQNTVTVRLYFKGHREDAEYILRRAVARVHWMRSAEEILCVDGGMDAETRKICEIVARKYPFVHICEENACTARQ